MKGETIIALVKEQEKIKSIRSRNNYFGAWCGFIVSIIWLARLYMLSIEKSPNQGLEWFTAFMFVVALVLCLQSFYIIVRHITNKKFVIIIEALLENKKVD
jgi:high-affinity Fe2+/Pb2+ permease